MKVRIHSLFFKILSCTASLALMLAMNSVSNTCCFLSYQPDIPEELNKFQP